MICTQEIKFLHLQESTSNTIFINFMPKHTPQYEIVHSLQELKSFLQHLPSSQSIHILCTSEEQDMIKNAFREEVPIQEKMDGNGESNLLEELEEDNEKHIFENLRNSLECMIKKTEAKIKKSTALWVTEAMTTIENEIKKMNKVHEENEQKGTTGDKKARKKAKDAAKRVEELMEQKKQIYGSALDENYLGKVVEIEDSESWSSLLCG